MTTPSKHAVEAAKNEVAETIEREQGVNSGYCKPEGFYIQSAIDLAVAEAIDESNSETHCQECGTRLRYCGPQDPETHVPAAQCPLCEATRAKDEALWGLLNIIKEIRSAQRAGNVVLRASWIERKATSDAMDEAHAALSRQPQTAARKNDDARSTAAESEPSTATDAGAAAPSMDAASETPLTDAITQPDESGFYRDGTTEKLSILARQLERALTAARRERDALQRLDVIVSKQSKTIVSLRAKFADARKALTDIVGASNTSWLSEIARRAIAAMNKTP